MLAQNAAAIVWYDAVGLMAGVLSVFFNVVQFVCARQYRQECERRLTCYGQAFAVVAQQASQARTTQDLAGVGELLSGIESRAHQCAAETGVHVEDAPQRQ